MNGSARSRHSPVRSRARRLSPLSTTSTVGSTPVGPLEEALAHFAAYPELVKALFGLYLDGITATAADAEPRAA
jgi:hypothetical protein